LITPVDEAKSLTGYNRAYLVQATKNSRTNTNKASFFMGMSFYFSGLTCITTIYGSGMFITSCLF
jgi:cytochrome c biogenesis protein CcdA